MLLAEEFHPESSINFLLQSTGHKQLTATALTKFVEKFGHGAANSDAAVLLINEWQAKLDQGHLTLDRFMELCRSREGLDVSFAVRIPVEPSRRSLAALAVLLESEMKL
jgi:uncharacterized protein YbgA (DUF1722 family)